MSSIDSIEDCIYYNPLSLLNIKNQKILDSIDNYLPYSTGFEIECDQLNFIPKKFWDIPDIMDVNCDMNEQRFRIPNGLKGLICLYNICERLKLDCAINNGSGIHYHIDMTDWFDSINKEIIELNSEWILKELDTWNYKGKYNPRQLGLDYNGWIKFQNHFKTAEFRIGEMSFDYNILVTRIIHANRIIKKFKGIAFRDADEIKLETLNDDLSKLKVEDFQINNQELTNITKSRTVIIKTNGKPRK